MESRKTKEELLGFNDLWTQVIMIPIVSVLLAYLISAGKVKIFSVQYAVISLVTFLFVVIYWTVDRQLILWLRRKMPSPEESVKRLLLTVVLAFGFLFAFHYTGGMLVSRGVEMLFPGPKVEISNGVVLTASLMVTLAAVGIYEAIYLGARWKEAMLRTERAQRESLQSQLDSLKSQVNPHFLFNSLNTLASLIPDDPDHAVDFVQGLAKIYRYILEIQDRELITVREEWKCVEAYLFLLQTRFGDNLKVEVDLPQAAMSLSLVPLAMQMAIENVVKHNVISQRKPLTLRICINAAGKLALENTLQQKDTTASIGKGLNNIRNRYQLITQQEIAVTTTAATFTLELPLISVADYEISHH